MISLALAGAEPSIQEKVAFLSDPTAYPDRPAAVTIRETHMSWVFLTDRTVYKLKKPAHVDGVDLGTVAARLRNAQAEVRLNRRLAAPVYLGLACLALDRRGLLSIDGAGRTVDWLVRMQRLPAGRMLDGLIADALWSAVDISGLAARLARFYATQRPVRLSATAYLAAFQREIRYAETELLGPHTGSMGASAARLSDALTRFIETHASMLTNRADKRFIVEGHGDLRPEHICLISPPQVIDCLEFRRDLRLLDPWDELSFLAMECARLGAPDIEPILFEAYARHAHDRPEEPLLNFYKAFRALVRARLAVTHLKDDAVQEAQKWLDRAAAYLALGILNIGRRG